MITIRRIYEPEVPNEKYKVFIDRLWPRGISKKKANWDEWMKEISPSEELRKWFNHDPNKWLQFSKKYKEELSRKQNEIVKLMNLEKEYGNLTLLYAAKDEEKNNAAVLQEYLNSIEVET